MEPNTLPDNERYQYLITQAIATKELWLLQSQPGFYAMFEDDNGQEYIPIWPDKTQATLHSKGDWEEYSPEKVELLDFVNWMKELKDDEIFIGAFPNLDLKAIPMNPMEIKKHLLDTLNK